MYFHLLFNLKKKHSLQGKEKNVATARQGFIGRFCHSVSTVDDKDKDRLKKERNVSTTHEWFIGRFWHSISTVGDKERDWTVPGYKQASQQINVETNVSFDIFLLTLFLVKFPDHQNTFRNLFKTLINIVLKW